MKNKIIAITNNKTSFLDKALLFLIEIIIEKSNYYGTTTGLLLAKLQKEQALALLQKTSSWNAQPIFELLNKTLQEDKEIILSAINKTATISSAISIISLIHNVLKKNPNLANYIADALINKYGINYQIRVKNILQTYLFFTEEEAKQMMGIINP